MGASISRLQRAGGNRQAAIAGLESDIQSGKLNMNDPQYAAYRDPATRAAWENQKIGETTKGKYSGVFGKAIQGLSKIAPYIAPFIPGIGPLAAAAISAGAGLAGGKNLGQSLTQGALTYGGAKLFGGAGSLNKAKGLIGATPATSGSGGFLSNIGNSLLTSIEKDPLKAAQYGLAGYSALSGAKAQGRSNAALNTALGSLGSESTLRPEDLSGIYGDPSNPYSQNPARPNSALSSARRALGGY